MHISELYKRKKPVISFEIFPPKQDGDVEKLKAAITKLKTFNPDFISITYGASGSDSQAKTLEIADLVKNEYGIEAMAHLTCIGATKEKINATLETLKSHNVENILALRGDLPKDVPDFSLSKDYQYAKDLIPDIKRHGMCAAGAAYPEGHIDCEDFDTSLRHLKEKVDIGAEFLTTQLFFENKLFYEFLEQALKIGINVPVVAGVMPILGINQVKRMIFMCGASLPAKIIKILNKYENNPESLKEAGIEYSYEQIADLIRNGIDGVHIYTMNIPDIAGKNVEKLKKAGLI